MKLSVRNFKSISSLEDFDLKPLTVIAGSNNSGKSSLFQILLLIGKTLGLASTSIGLADTENLPDLVFQKHERNKLGFSFLIEKEEFSDSSFYGDYGMAKESPPVRIVVEYQLHGDRAPITDFEFSFEGPSAKEQNWPFLRISNGPKYRVQTNVLNFGQDLLGFEPKALSDLRFESFFPLDYRLETGDGEGESNVNRSFTLPPIKEFLTDFFSRISYIAPYREAPKSFYPIPKKQNAVGHHGQFTARVLYDRRDDTLNYYTVCEKDNTTFEIRSGSFLEGVNYWFCENFKVCKTLFAEEAGGVYRIFLKNDSGLTMTVDQVGFGISQILPIVVEGLALPSDGILIVEEPESHLHPKLQSSLFDFLYSLVLTGKSVWIETHSDHLITRMRRRAAEEIADNLVKNLNFSFVMSTERATFRNIRVDEFGITEYFPEDFIELSTEENLDLLEAQLAKQSKTEK
jgi:hypothetical protein